MCFGGSDRGLLLVVCHPLNLPRKKPVSFLFPTDRSIHGRLHESFDCGRVTKCITSSSLNSCSDRFLVVIRYELARTHIVQPEVLWQFTGVPLVFCVAFTPAQTCIISFYTLFASSWNCPSVTDS
jgi:hypothetical protein